MVGVGESAYRTLRGVKRRGEVPAYSEQGSLELQLPRDVAGPGTHGPGLGRCPPLGDPELLLGSNGDAEGKGNMRLPTAGRVCLTWDGEAARKSIGTRYLIYTSFLEQ